MKRSDTGTCRLCERQSKLCKSHIVPEFMYQPLYHDRTLLAFKETSRGSKPTRRQKGYREHLLCGDCEAHLNDAYERQNAEVWRALVGREERNGVSLCYGKTESGTEFADVAGLEYCSAKLLLLSVLWRAGVARGREYSAVRLGPLEPRIREMLINKNPGPQLLFPCIVTFLKDSIRLISPPARIRYKGYTTYQIILTNIVLWFFVANKEVDDEIAEASLNEAGELQALITEPGVLPIYDETMKFLRKTKAATRQSE